MTTFVDGPAQGQHLMLRRAVRYLRVTEAAGTWDALDQETDTPLLQEKLYAYELVGEVGHCHIRASGGRGGFYPIMRFRLCVPQPIEETMRHNDRWQIWCVHTNLRRLEKELL